MFLAMATQTERRAETRDRLLRAAREVIAERGVDGASVDAIAERAGRTSGAIYDHFGGKDGLLFAVVRDLVGVVSENVVAELSGASSFEEAVGVLWHSISGTSGDTDQWMTLEYELWAYSVRRPEIREHLLRRYRVAWRGVATALAPWANIEESVGPAIVATMFGLEMLRRVDGASIPDELAVATLIAVMGGTKGGK